MTPQEAWVKVQKEVSDVVVETAYEIDKLYVFSIRPSETKPGHLTFTTIMTVDKRSGKVEGLLMDDPRLLRGKYLKMLDPSTFE